METTERVSGKPTEFMASGGSPPRADLPAHLVDQLADILAEALVADVQQFPSLEATRPLAASTANSPRGFDRSGAVGAVKDGAGAVVAVPQPRRAIRRRKRQP